MLLYVKNECRGDAPLRVYDHDERGGLLVGDGEARVLLTVEEVRDLYRLLAPYAEKKGG